MQLLRLRRQSSLRNAAPEVEPAPKPEPEPELFEEHPAISATINAAVPQRAKV